MVGEELAHLEDATANCMKCGFCMAACPLFLGEETTSPRARVRLARAVARGELAMSGKLTSVMAQCLNCRACAVECPSGVEPNRIVLGMRDARVRREGLPLAKRLIFRGALRRPRLMAWGLRGLGLAQMVTGIELRNNPLRSLLPLARIRRDKDLPVLGRRSLFSILPETLDPLTELKTTVVYFPGCAVNFLYPEIGLAAVSILRKLGARVVMPHGLVCCSTPVFNSGDFEGARRLARANIELLSSIEADHVITSCGSCGLTISREWTEVLAIAEATGIAAKVLDIARFVARYVPDSALKELDEAEMVTYHDSCHLRRGIGVYEEPRQLLKAALGERFVEMELADRCCGGGGTFSIYQPELSQAVAEVKMRCVAESGARVVAAGCPACIMQIRDSVLHRRMTQRAVHTVEIIDRALRPGE